jgi:hypothetical protein
LKSKPADQKMLSESAAGALGGGRGSVRGH